MSAGDGESDGPTDPLRVGLSTSGTSFGSFAPPYDSYAGGPGTEVDQEKRSRSWRVCRVGTSEVCAAGSSPAPRPQVLDGCAAGPHRERLTEYSVCDESLAGTL